MRGAIPPLPDTPLWRGAQLKKHRDDFTFTERSFYDIYMCIEAKGHFRVN